MAIIWWKRLEQPQKHKSRQQQANELNTGHKPLNYCDLAGAAESHYLKYLTCVQTFLEVASH